MNGEKQESATQERADTKVEHIAGKVLDVTRAGTTKVGHEYEGNAHNINEGNLIITDQVHTKDLKKQHPNHTMDAALFLDSKPGLMQTVRLDTLDKGKITITASIQDKDDPTKSTDKDTPVISKPIAEAMAQAMHEILKDHFTKDHHLIKASFTHEEAEKLATAEKMLIGAVGKDGKFDESQTQNIVKAFNAAEQEGKRGR